MEILSLPENVEMRRDPNHTNIDLTRLTIAGLVDAVTIFGNEKNWPTPLLLLDGEATLPYTSTSFGKRWYFYCISRAAFGGKDIDNIPFVLNDTHSLAQIFVPSSGDCPPSLLTRLRHTIFEAPILYDQSLFEDKVQRCAKDLQSNSRR